ncbi:MAG: methylenetetrahydrofolate reductase C-terminal domain-containing protein [Armatimonadetes bacterium]|nr:methylenetetrahydrofolate reductase C-terminal domain-containing protein [Armatimonadota bacterium]
MNENAHRSALSRGEFVYSAELVLGRDHDIPDTERFIREAAADPAGIRIVSATDLPGGNPALPPEAFLSSALAQGLTPIAHLTGKDGNRAFLEGRLLALARTGAHNVLCLTGDAQREGFEGAGKPVFDLDSVLILNLVSAMRDGIEYNMGRRALQATPFDFFPGAVVNPYKQREPDQMMQLYKLELKIASGARYVLTQLGFNLRKLYELKQYLRREGLGQVPIIPSVYVPTATSARRMDEGLVAGCVVPEALLRALQSEEKPERLERAALMVAAIRDLGFAGAHIGGHGLSHADIMRIIDRARGIGTGWRARLDELILATPGEYYIFPQGPDGFSDDTQPYRVGSEPGSPGLLQRACILVNRLMIADGSPGARFFAERLKPANGRAWQRGFWHDILAAADLFKKDAFGCVQCGDCTADHLGYTRCSQGDCCKETRNGPCGGSRPDGTCEVNPERPCVWNLAYQAARARGEDGRRYAETLVPPRDWSLNRTTSLANHYRRLDNAARRRTVSARAATADGERDTAPEPALSRE